MRIADRGRQRDRRRRGVVIRVCYVVDAPFLGGAELYVSRLAGALNKREFSATVLMRRDARDPRLVQWADELRAGGTDVHAIPMRLPFAPLDAWHLFRALDSVAPHVVHVNMPGPYDGQFGLVLPIARATGARTVVTEHLPMVEYLWKRAALKRAAYRFLDLAVTMTEANARLVAERQGVAPIRSVERQPGDAAVFDRQAVSREKLRGCADCNGDSARQVYEIVPERPIQPLETEAMFGYTS
jgi:hypothetical protein